MRASGLLTIALLLILAPAGAAQRRPDSRSRKDISRKDTSPSESSKTVKLGGRTLDGWMLELRSGDPSRRAAAIMILPSFGKEAARAVPALLDRCLDRDVSPRVKAVIMLRFIEVRDDQVAKVVKSLASRVSNINEYQAVVRYEAAVTLGRFAKDAHDAIPALARGTQDSASWEIRKVCVQVLWQAAYDAKKGPDPVAVRALITALRDPTVQVRMEAIRGLGALGKARDPKLTAQVIAALSNQVNTGSLTAPISSRVLAIWAATAIHVIEGKSDVDIWIKRIAKFLHNKDLQVRVQAASALGALGKKSKGFVGPLKGLLEDKEPEAVQAGCLALAQIGEPRETILDAIKGVLGHKDPNVVVTACQALIHMKAKGADVFLALEHQMERKDIDKRLVPVLDQTLKELKKPQTPPKPAALAPRR
jgi:HEAT repeat protein